MLTAGSIAQAMSGVLLSGPADTRIDGFSIDSRTLRPGDLFLAIAGPRFDGHQFVQAAVTSGACGVVVSRDVPLITGSAGTPVVIRVADTTAALQALARHVRRKSGTRVIAVTGSTGKTTTKELAANLLAVRYRVFRNQGNLNNHIGLPLSLLELRRGPDLAVVELGMNHAGEIRLLAGIAEPDVRVWTNVAEVHAEFFPSIDAIADAKAEILEGATHTTLVVANAADPRVMARVAQSAARVVTFGIDVAAGVTASATAAEIVAVIDGTRHRFTSRPGEAVVDAALRARVRAPNACKGGMCSTCRARVVEGRVSMRVNYSLEPWELEKGFVLTCQSIPETTRLIVDYDEM
jgi:UDP-N-acetylmuramoyl-tripeptide--D-alanyl-D-alanine ligase